MLTKPMQKITRYPLLFKRLLPNMVTDSQEQIDLVRLLTEMEHVLSRVNEKAREMHAKFRIKELEKTLEFGVVADVTLW
jgi:hypothetical protein